MHHMLGLTFGTAYAGAIGKSMGATAASAKAVRENINTSLKNSFYAFYQANL